MLLYGLLCCLIGYLLGNLSPAYLFGKAKGYDVREEGSKNVGATDILKAFIAWKLCRWLFPDLGVAGPLGGVSCIIGHMYPLFLGFRGGKGMASLGGVILAWRWEWFLLLLGLAIVIAFVTRYVSLVAPTISLVFPGCYYWRTGLLGAALILTIPAIPIFIKHRENFRRIAAGTELRTSFIWNKEQELRRIGEWNEKTETQLENRD